MNCSYSSSFATMILTGYPWLVGRALGSGGNQRVALPVCPPIRHVLGIVDSYCAKKITTQRRANNKRYRKERYFLYTSSFFALRSAIPFLPPVRLVKLSRQIKSIHPFIQPIPKASTVVFDQTCRVCQQRSYEWSPHHRTIATATSTLGDNFNHALPALL